jgi:hypothetical protein
MQAMCFTPSLATALRLLTPLLPPKSHSAFSAGVGFSIFFSIVSLRNQSHS